MITTSYTWERIKGGAKLTLNPFSAGAFFGLFLKKYRKFDFVTQFLRNGSTKIQSYTIL